MTERHPCRREGCPGSYNQRMHREGMRYCSPVCNRLDSEMDHYERIARANDDPEREADYTAGWLALVEAGDKLSEYHHHRAAARQGATNPVPPRRDEPSKPRRRRNRGHRRFSEGSLTQTIGESVSA